MISAVQDLFGRRRNWSRWGILIAALSVTLLASSIAVNSQANDRDSLAECTAVEGQVATKRFHDLEAMLRPLDGYTGIALTQPCGPVAVYGLAASGVESQVATLPAGDLEVTFVTVAHSAEELARHHDLVRAVNADLLRRGVDVVSFWPEITTGMETISVKNLSDRDVTVIHELLDIEVDVRSTDTSIELTVTRANDRAPFSAATS